MATITSAQTGDWNIGATWVGGVVPAATDRAVIETTHTVSITASMAIGDSPATTTADVLIVYGNLTLNTGVTVTCNGDVLVDPTAANDGTWTQLGTAAFVHNGDYRFRFDGSDLEPTTMLLQGTVGSRCSFSAAIGGSTYFVSLAGTAWNDIIAFDCDYCDFTRVDGNTATFIDNGQNNTVQNWSFDKCLFNSCGNIRFGSGSTVGSACIFEILNSHFINPSNVSIIEHKAAQAFNTDTRRFLNLTVIGTSGLNEIRIGTNVSSEKIQISGVLQDCRINNLGGAPTDVQIATRFKLYIGTLTEILIDPTIGGSIVHDCYCYSDRANPHNFSVGGDTVTGCVMETTQSAANQILINGSATVQQNITIGGAGVSQVGGGSTAVLVRRHTHIQRVGNYDTMFLSEGVVWDANLITIRSCLVDGINSSDRGISSITSTQDLAYSDFNCFYNISDNYYDISVANNTLIEGVSAGFGAGDIVVDPSFVDDTASVTTWDASLGGSGTVDSAFIEMLKSNNFDSVGNFTTFNPNYTGANLIAWMIAAYTPLNSALSGSGFSGEDIGAVAVYTGGFLPCFAINSTIMVNT